MDECCNGHVSRRDWLKLASLFTAGGAAPLLAAGAARAQAEPDAPVRIGYLPITDAAPLLVAHNNGLFEAEGLRVEKPVLMRSWPQVIEAFLAGQVNVIHLLSPMTVWARYGSQVPAKVVAWNHMSGSGITVAPSIGGVADLGGQTVAVPFWYSIHNIMLQHLLKSHGLTPVLRKSGALGAQEVRLVIMAPADMPPALAAGQVAGYIVAEPFNAVAENLKVGKILRFTGDIWQNHACCLVTMHERDLQQRPEWSQKVVNAIVKAQLWTRSHRAEAAQLLSKDGPNRYTPHPLPALQKVLTPPASDREVYLASKAIIHPQWKDERIAFQPYPYPSYMEELVRRMKTTQIEGSAEFLGQLDPAQVARELIDDRYVRQAIEAVGGMSAFGQPAGYSRRETIEA